MAQSVKLKDGSYIDTEGIYDVTQGMTQAEINTLLSFKEISKVRFGFDDNNVNIYFFTSDTDFYQLKAYITQKLLRLIKYDSSTKTYTTIWDITS